jgi:hypothetical protein
MNDVFNQIPLGFTSSVYSLVLTYSVAAARFRGGTIVAGLGSSFLRLRGGTIVEGTGTDLT